MIYYIEDDASIRTLVLYTLKSVGYEAEGFDSSALFWQRLRDKSPDLVLLDIMLPGESGLHILQRLKEDPRTMQIPVMMLTARDAEDEIVTGLDLGADDYMAKPFGILELIARVKAILRRAVPAQSPEELICGQIILDQAGRVVTAAGKPVNLTLKEYQILSLLMSRPERVLERTEILDQVWSKDYFGGDHTLDAHMQTLRHKLGPCGNQIRTIYGLGYKLTGEDAL